MRAAWLLALLALAAVCVIVAMRRPSMPSAPDLDQAVQRRRRAAEVAGARARADQDRDRARPRVIVELAGLTEAFARSGDWALVLSAADVYARGCFPTHAPRPRAAESLLTVAARCPDPDVAGMAQARLLDLGRVPAEDVRGEELPGAFAARIEALAQQRVRSTPVADFLRPIRVHRNRPPSRDPAPTPLPTPTPTPTPTPVRVPRPAATARPDSQNVHDHGVMAATRTRLAALRTGGPPQGSLDDIRAAFDGLTDLSDEDRGNAELVLASLGTVQHSSLGCSETEAALRVFDRVRALPDDVRANAVETFAKQLASGVERGHVVCSTGKIARMAGSLDGVDVERPAARPMWAVQDELAGMAARVRDRVLSSEDAVARYNQGDEGLERDMRDRFRADARAEYVDGLGMDPVVLDRLVDAVAAGF